MRLTTLGTGTISLTAERVCAGHLVEAGDVRLLLDCGSGVAHRLAHFDLPWREITHVAFTHFHTDHMADFVTLACAWKHGARFGRTAPVTVIGPEGVTAVVERLLAAFDERLEEMGFPITVLEIAPGQTLDLGDGVRLGATKVPHTAESVLRIARVRRIRATPATIRCSASGRAALTCCCASARCPRRQPSLRISPPSSAAQLPRLRCRSTSC